MLIYHLESWLEMIEDDNIPDNLGYVYIKTYYVFLESFLTSNDQWYEYLLLKGNDTKSSKTGKTDKFGDFVEEKSEITFVDVTNLKYYPNNIKRLVNLLKNIHRNLQVLSEYHPIKRWFCELIDSLEIKKEFEEIKELFINDFFTRAFADSAGGWLFEISQDKRSTPEKLTEIHNKLESLRFLKNENLEKLSDSLKCN